MTELSQRLRQHASDSVGPTPDTPKVMIEAAEEIERLEERLNQLRAAWTVEGYNPAYHAMWQQKLSDGWPVLAAAIKNAVKP